MNVVIELGTIIYEYDASTGELCLLRCGTSENYKLINAGD
jgi:hypothetical protein